MRRTVLLREHAADIQDVQARAARVREGMIAHETRINAMDGMSPRLAEIAAKNNLTVRLRGLDDEVLTERPAPGRASAEAGEVAGGPGGRRVS